MFQNVVLLKIFEKFPFNWSCKLIAYDIDDESMVLYLRAFCFCISKFSVEHSNLISKLVFFCILLAIIQDGKTDKGSEIFEIKAEQNTFSEV